ncbi:MAG: hypothetical protein M1817_001855 [Caeruleum heppii]|nr:MAG: hypothetical protein M1817_001855 [Caeruleum heppii]
MRPSTLSLRTLTSFPLPLAVAARQDIRLYHQRMAPAKIPTPTPFVPNVETFLTLIGRDLKKHAAKITSWEALFSLSGAQLRKLGVEPPRDRRYLLRWRDKFRSGVYGVGGDVTAVTDGVGEVRIEVRKSETAPVSQSADPNPETPPISPRRNKLIVANLPPDIRQTSARTGPLKPVNHLKVKGRCTITGPYVQPVGGKRRGLGRIAVQEGLWEDRRGRKTDGGERRRAEVRAKRNREERKNARG